MVYLLIDRNSQLNGGFSMTIKQLFLTVSIALALPVATYSGATDIFGFEEPTWIERNLPEIVAQPTQWVHTNIINNHLVRFATLGAFSQIPLIPGNVKFYAWLTSCIYDALYWQAEDVMVLNKTEKNKIDFNSPTFKKRGLGYLGTLGVLAYGQGKGFINIPAIAKYIATLLV